MSHQDMYQQLEVLKASLAESKGIDDAARGRMLTLIDDLEAQLGDSSRADTGLVTQLEEHVTEFEVSHPALSGTINEIMRILANMGV